MWCGFIRHLISNRCHKSRYHKLHNVTDFISIFFKSTVSLVINNASYIWLTVISIDAADSTAQTGTHVYRWETIWQVFSHCKALKRNSWFCKMASIFAGCFNITHTDTRHTLTHSIHKHKRKTISLSFFFVLRSAARSTVDWRPGGNQEGGDIEGGKRGR